MKKHINTILSIILIATTTIQCYKKEYQQSIPKNQFTKHDKTKQHDTLQLKDGLYCAEVNYSNPHTGTNSTYNLYVEIEDNQLIKIKWPNGGWLDDSHFIPPEIENRTATFTTHNEINYTVTILKDNTNCGNSKSKQEKEK